MLSASSTASGIDVASPKPIEASFSGYGANAPRTLTTPCAAGAHKYRGAVVEDLQLPPAFALPYNETICHAVELAYERDFSFIPILSRNRKPLGYIDVAALKVKWEAGEANTSDTVMKYMTKFQRGPSQKYTLITPETPLHELEAFLQNYPFALLTDAERKFVLAVATKSDLDAFVSRRGRNTIDLG